MDTVQQAFDIFIEYGMSVDALTPSWLQDEYRDQFLNQGESSLFKHFPAAVLVSDIYVDLDTPFYLRPTVLDMTYNLNKEVFSYLVRYSKKTGTGFTRSGLYIAAERGGDHLSEYFDTWCFESAECLRLLELILFEQFVLQFDLNVTHMFLKRGVSFGAFPQDLNLSLPLGNLVATIKKKGIGLEMLEIFSQLLEQGAIIDADIITIAVERQGTKLLELLLGYGADFATHGAPALFMAAVSDNYEAVDWLLEAGVDINVGINIHGEPTTIVGGFFKKLSRYRDIWQRPVSRYDLYFDIYYDRILDFAGGLSIPMLKYLVGRGASLRSHPRNSQPNNLLFHAIMTGKHRPDILEMITYIIGTQGGFLAPLSSQPCLLEACFQNHWLCSHRGYGSVMGCGLPIFNRLLASGVPIMNSGVLSLLIKYGAAMDLIQMVIDAGVDVNTYSGGGELCCHGTIVIQRTPLQAAAEAGKLELVKNLVGLGAEINLPAKGFHGRTALQAACWRDCESSEERRTTLEIIKFLIDNGADVNAPGASEEGVTAFKAAAGSGDIEIAMLLLNHGADFNAPPAEYGHCALDAAAYYGRLDMTKILLDLGALSGERGENGYAGAIERAEWNCHGAVAKLIREYAMRSSQIRSALAGSGFRDDG
ncbi:ankyrin repeat-containing domain protein [Xylaria sp. FL1042]|nr:ankyrin repeat-containing domain protein [Xylaria sp. FL1042]